MLLPLLISLSVASAAADDAELRARFELSAPPGASFSVVSGRRLEPARFCAGAVKCEDPETRWDINWGSAPDTVFPLQVSEEEARGARVLLTSDRGDPLLLARGSTVLVAFETAGEMRLWPYFNYLLYSAASDAVGLPAQPFCEWPHAPVPQGGAKRAFLAGFAGLWAVLLLAFRFARRQGRRRPQAAQEFFAAVASASGRASGGTSWNRAGFARPLAGLLTHIGTMSVMAGAYFVLQWVMSGKIQPFPQADGLWRTTYDFLIVVAALFELGINVAVVKYFAEHRVQEPAEALKDVQFYAWWCFFQRTAQATLLGAIALWVLPPTEYAIYAPFVALFGVMGLPSVFQLGKLMTAALQRFDYQNLLDLAEQRVLVYLVPMGFVLLGRSWGQAHPVYGEVFGAALGLAVGQLAAFLVTLLIGLWALRRLELPLGPLFLAQFDRGTARRMLTFGGKLAIGAEPVFLIRSIETIVIVTMMQDFTTWNGIRDLLSTRIFMLFQFSSVFFAGAVPAFSEAFSAGKRRLTQYYAARYLQFGLFFAAVIFSLLLALGPAYIRAMGPQWERAIPFLWLAMIYGLFLPPVCVSDQLQQGAGRPGTYLAVMFLEQGTRLGLLIALVPRLQFTGILIASVSALALKAVVGWVVNHYTIVKFHFSVRAALLAPAIGALANFLLWRGLIALWGPTSSVAVIVLVCVAAGLSFFIGFFVYALAGGLDEAALGELRQAADMVSVGRPVARALSRLADLGAQLAPLKARPLAITGEAQAEAAALDAAAAAALAEREQASAARPAAA